MGGLGVWKPKARRLTEAERKRAHELTKRRDELRRQLQEVFEKARANDGKVDAKVDAKLYRPIQEQISAAEKELGALVPSLKRQGLVWLYRRK